MKVTCETNLYDQVLLHSRRWREAICGSLRSDINFFHFLRLSLLRTTFFYRLNLLPQSFIFRARICWRGHSFLLSFVLSPIIFHWSMFEVFDNDSPFRYTLPWWLSKNFSFFSFSSFWINSDDFNCRCSRDAELFILVRKAETKRSEMKTPNRLIILADFPTSKKSNRNRDWVIQIVD